MAKLIEQSKPVEKTYTVELTQSEIDFITGIMHDLADFRSVYMVYPIDGSEVRPSLKGFKAADSIAKALLSTQDIDNYDYFDYWSELTEDEKKALADPDSSVRW